MLSQVPRPKAVGSRHATTSRGGGADNGPENSSDTGLPRWQEFRPHNSKVPLKVTKSWRPNFHQPFFKKGNKLFYDTFSYENCRSVYKMTFD
jgi:hypothetical protein